MKPYKIFTIGLLTGVIATCSTSAFAAIGDKVEAVFATFNYKVNGTQKIIDKNSIVVDGDSYLPVRVIANMLGYDVTYKADNRTIEFNAASSTQTTTTQEKPSSNVPQQQQQSSQQSPSVDKEKYLKLRDVAILYGQKGYGFYYDNKSNSIYITYNSDPSLGYENKKTILSNITQFTIIDGDTFLEKEFFEKFIKPHLS